nr:hypothetical protein [Tanacetum cinerariifolium]
MSRLHGFFNLLPEVNALVCIVALGSVKLTEFVLVLIFYETGHGGSALNFTISISMISFGVLISGVNRSCILPDLFRPLKSSFFSKLDLGMLSFDHLIRSWFVIPCMNPKILRHSGAPFTCKLLALKRSMNASVDSPPFALCGEVLQDL